MLWHCLQHEQMSTKPQCSHESNTMQQPHGMRRTHKHHSPLRPLAPLLCWHHTRAKLSRAAAALGGHRSASRSPGAAASRWRTEARRAAGGRGSARRNPRRGGAPAAASIAGSCTKRALAPLIHQEHTAPTIMHSRGPAPSPRVEHGEVHAPAALHRLLLKGAVQLGPAARHVAAAQGKGKGARRGGRPSCWVHKWASPRLRTEAPMRSSSGHRRCARY